MREGKLRDLCRPMCLCAAWRTKCADFEIKEIIILSPCGRFIHDMIKNEITHLKKSPRLIYVFVSKDFYSISKDYFFMFEPHSRP